jgi:ribosomal protein L7/L12
MARMPSQTLPQLMEQVDRLERQVLVLSEKLGLPFESPLTAAMPEEVVDLIQAGDKLAALKRYRELTGAGSTEAAAAIEKLQGA